jgi:hypothetical protein
MFAPAVEGLTEAIDRLGAPVTCDDLDAVLRLADRLTALASSGIGEVDAAELWDAEDAVSMTAWLRQPLRATHAQVSRPLARARKLRALPATRAAWETGRLSTAQVDAIVARLTPVRLPAYMACETEIVEHLEHLDGPATVDFLAAWANGVDALVEPDPADLDGSDPDGGSELHASRTLADRTEVSGSLEADLGMIVRAALRAATTTDGPEDPVRSPAQKRADALADICKFFLDHHDHPNPTPKNRPHVGVVLDYDDLLTRGQGTLIDSGEPISAETIQQLLCDAAVHRILRKGSSTILDLGRTTPVVSPAQHAALAVRDGGCRWPGCDRPPSWCDAHHIEHWGADYGPTALANLALLCRRHHRRIHRRGTFARLDLATAQLTITLPTGRVISSEPRVRATTNAPPV